MAYAIMPCCGLVWESESAKSGGGQSQSNYLNNLTATGWERRKREVRSFINKTKAREVVNASNKQ